MADRQKFEVGHKTAFSTRCVGDKTYLLIEPYYENAKTEDTTCTWHIDLCREPDHDVSMTQNSPKTYRIDISGAAGALVSVRNTGTWPFYAWTDY